MIILAMVIVDMITLILGTTMATIIHSTTLTIILAILIVSMRMMDTDFLTIFLILMITLVMSTVDMEMKKQAMGMVTLVLKAWISMSNFLRRRLQWLRQQEVWLTLLLDSSSSFYM
jgi:hypothetical protein